MQLITRHRRREVRRSWLALTATLATVLLAGVTATSAAAAAGPPQNTTRPTISGTAVVGKGPDRPSRKLERDAADHLQVPLDPLQRDGDRLHEHRRGRPESDVRPDLCRAR